MSAESPTRFAYVLARRSDLPEIERKIAAYLPGNYRMTGRWVFDSTDNERFVRILIEGEDACGWTLQDYVAPRLGSGMYGCTECDAEGNDLFPGGPLL